MSAQKTTRLGAGNRPVHHTISRFQIERVDQPDHTPQIFEGRCTIGRSDYCSFTIDDDTVSQCHCEIEIIDKQGPWLSDLGSINGTLVDGTRVVKAMLKTDSVIRVGRTDLRFRPLGKRRASITPSQDTSFGLLVGQSMAMRTLFTALRTIADTDSKVLLEGETGSGKSVTARSIHRESARASGPFVAVDCGAIPSNLIESELFGHAKGAFTGAHSDRKGAFEEAHSGVLFLDEIGELPKELQPKLLLALDSGEIKRVGENRTRSVDIRIIAATNRDLRTEINAGRFREDLYYRLAIAQIRLPPLRERSEDIPVLAREILRRLKLPDERIAELLAPGFLDELQGAAWPGNIRQLSAHLERSAYGIPQPLDDDGEPRDDALRIAVDTSRGFQQFRDMAVAEIERAYVTQLLREHGNNVSRAAEAAGMHRSWLYKLRDRYKLGG